MQPIKPVDVSLEISPPSNWDKEKNGNCCALPVVIANDGFGNQVTCSLWQPDAAELEALSKGLPVLLMVFGGSVPPLAVTVAAHYDRVTKPEA